MAPVPVDIYMDFVCPFCLLVEPAVQKLQQQRDVSVTVRPFELRPAPVPTLRPEDDYLPRVWRESVYPMAERVGVPIRLPSISPQPRTEKAFLVLQLAQEQGLGNQYSQAVLRAFFQEDQDIGRDDVLVATATSVGLLAHDVRDALSGAKRRARHRADLRHAVQEVGISAVPGIVVGGHLLQGVPGATRLVNAVDAALGFSEGAE